MQTTLLGIGIAVIVALVAAFLGPSFIDWSQHRGPFEAQASRLIGQPVRIQGPIEFRLLPEPRVVLRDVAIAPDFREIPRARVDEIRVDLELGALVRGEWRATEARLVRPAVTVDLDAEGRLDWPAFDAAGAETTSIGRLEIQEGRVEIWRDGAVAVTIEDLRLGGELFALSGPFRGEGGFVANGARYGVRLATGRGFEDGALRLRLGIEPTDAPSVIDLDGRLGFEDGRPTFRGGLTIARPEIPSRTPAFETAPWRVTAQVTATPVRVLAERLELRHGPDERGLGLAGTAELLIAPDPRLDVVLSARQIDLDRALGEERALPATALVRLARAFPALARPPIPARVGLGIDGVVVGGAIVQNLRADVASTAAGFDIQSFEARLPGASGLRASGLLATGEAPRFAGPVVLDARDPRALAAWLDPGFRAAGAITQGARLEGRVDLGPTGLAIEGLRAEIDRKPLTGRLVWTHAPDATLDAQLAAERLDLDWLVALARAAGLDTPEGRPARVLLGLEGATATFAGVEARGFELRLAADGGTIALERLSIADLGGVRATAQGRLGPGGGELAGTLAGDRLDAVAGVLAAVAPDDPVVATLVPVLPRLAPVRLDLAARTGPDGRLALTVGGTAATGRIEARLAAPLVPFAPFGPAGEAALTLATPDQAALWRVLGLDLPSAARGPATLTLAGRGGADGFALDAGLTAPGTAITLRGPLRPGRDASGTLALALRLPDAGPWLADVAGLPGGVLPAIPIEGQARLVITPQRAAMEGIEARVAGEPVTGRLVLSDAGRPRLDGEIAAGAIDGRALAAALAGLGRDPAARADALWPEIAFTMPEPAIDAAVVVTSRRLALSPIHDIEGARFTLDIRPGRLALTEVTGALAGGQLTGGLDLQPRDGQLAAVLRMALSGADAGRLLAGDGRAAVGGRLGATIELEGRGRSPAALAGTLSGGGTVVIEGASLAALDPRAFEAVIRLADAGAEPTEARVREVVTAGFDAGRLDVPRIETPVTVAGGVMRTGNVALVTPQVTGQASLALDLARLSLDVRLTVGAPRFASQPGQPGPQVALALRGPVDAPRRTIDVAPLTSWLTVRRFEREVERLEALEAEREQRERRLREDVAPPPRPVPPVARPPEAPRAPGPAPAPRASTPQRDGDWADAVRRALDAGRATDPPVLERDRLGGDQPRGAGAPGVEPGRAAPLPAPIEIGPGPGPRRPAAVPAP